MPNFLKCVFSKILGLPFIKPETEVRKVLETWNYKSKK